MASGSKICVSGVCRRTACDGGGFCFSEAAACSSLSNSSWHSSICSSLTSFTRHGGETAVGGQEMAVWSGSRSVGGKRDLIAISVGDTTGARAAGEVAGDTADGADARRKGRCVDGGGGMQVAAAHVDDGARTDGEAMWEVVRGLGLLGWCWWREVTTVLRCWCLARGVTKETGKAGATAETDGAGTVVGDAGATADGGDRAVEADAVETDMTGAAGVETGATAGAETTADEATDKAEGVVATAAGGAKTLVGEAGATGAAVRETRIGAAMGDVEAAAGNASDTTVDGPEESGVEAAEGETGTERGNVEAVAAAGDTTEGAGEAAAVGVIKSMMAGGAMAMATGGAETLEGEATIDGVGGAGTAGTTGAGDNDPSWAYESARVFSLLTRL
ncbi:hypothetical protein F5148DRAFT_1370809 [Russula earlei]|uniref:Uncharacterized protein n=1 Tax=Russula earlei TaxID=71964 RepID=A0ACC0TVA8_9AGAM|nr:hypothetical protein F5148DRAFT_1370809 [Russula earlei]